MSQPLHPEVAILGAALELPPDQRAAFLAKACADDPLLRGQVHALLLAHEHAEDFLEAPLTGVPPRSITAADIPHREKPGERIGRYKLIEQIGEGGCGIVYLAEQEEPVCRRVALKVIKLGMDTKEVIARFEAERQALALMDHPNIAKVLDAGSTAAGRPYFVMELVGGVKITDFCDENRLSTEDRLKLFIQVCQAIQHAHQKGIIHRDIKPSNILVTVNDGVPVPKVIDFGIAKATQGRLTDKTLFTAFEQFIGTPAYMSPEQAVITSLDIDTRSDIYSLGVLLYELLTGRTPFDQKELLAIGLDEMRRTIREVEPVKPSTRLTQELLRTQGRRGEKEKRGGEAVSHSKSPPPPFSPAPFPPRPVAEPQQDNPAAVHRAHQLKQLIPELRGDLDWIAMKCLEKDRTLRYQTANGLAADVQHHLNNEPVSARPPSNLYRLQKVVQRNRLAFVAGAAGAVALVLALVVLGISNVRITRERNQKDAALKERGSALDAAHASEQQAKDELFVSLRSQAQARRYSRRMGQRLDSLAAVAEAARLKADPGLRDDAIAAMALPDVRRGFKWTMLQTNCVATACDATYRRYAVLDRQGRLMIRNIADDQDLQQLDTSATNPVSTILLFSPDGRFLAQVQEGQKSQVWLLETGESILQTAPRSAFEPAFSPDTRLIAFPDRNSVHCFDLATGRERIRWSTAGKICSLNFHPRDGRIAIGYSDQALVSIHDSADGRELTQLPLGSGVRGVVRWHPEGRKLAVGSSDPRIQIWDVEERRKLTTLDGHVQDVNFLSFHPGGEWLASASWEGVVRLWDFASARQALQLPLSGLPRFSKDGRWLGCFLAGEEHAQLLEFAAPQEYYTLQSSPGPTRVEHHFPASSPDGRLLAIAMSDGVRLWDLGREVAFLPIGLSFSVQFEADGGALLTCAPETGLQRWALRQSATNAAELWLGPPQRIELPFAPQRMVLDRTGQTLAVLSEAAGQTLVLDLATRAARGTPMRHAQAGFIALSPDGNWLATSGWHSSRVRLWNARSSELVQEWVVGVYTRVSFTPDSRELVIARPGEFKFIDVQTLQPSRRLPREADLHPGDVVFSPDGKLMAMEMAPGVIHLKEASSARTVAQLEDPFADRSNWMTFGAEGTKLIVVATHPGALRVWDLRAIRARLKSMGLDWDWPEFPPTGKRDEPRVSRAPGPLKVRIIGDEAQ